MLETDMNSKFAALIDPTSLEEFTKQDDFNLSTRSGITCPIVRGIPRFVSNDNYANAFGDQWNRFPTTQLDSHTGIPLSENRLARCMPCELKDIAGKRVLEAGSGAGRFTEILLKHGAIVDSFDYSNAVDANSKNNGSSESLTLVQADIRKIPFRKETYDYVICLGVLQHTPDPEESIRALWSMVKPGGYLIIDHYRWKVRNYLPPPFGVAGIVYRRFFLRLPKQEQFKKVKRVFDFWFPFVWEFRDSKVAQFVLSRLTPIVCYYPHFGLRDKEMYYEWMLLDTHDAMTDVYKHRRNLRQIRNFLEHLGATEIRVSHGGNGIEASCSKIR
jgi:2-polyprenyl-3-methyl-5-hydroxy-6-metoxy-1,4-benzoquinol methylase